MFIELDHHSGVPIYRQIIDQIKQQIIAGRLEEGGQIMSVRDLSRRLKVNPMTVSKSYALLELEGLLERQRGVGLFVAKVGHKRQREAKRKMLEKGLKKVVTRAMQFGVSEKELQRLLKEVYGQYSSKTGRQKWEVGIR